MVDHGLVGEWIDGTHLEGLDGRSAHLDMVRSI